MLRYVPFDPDYQHRLFPVIDRFSVLPELANFAVNAQLRAEYYIK
jgi:hypothetical protein